MVVKGLGSCVGFLAWSLAIACGGSSVRHGDGGDSDDGMVIPRAGQGGTGAGDSDGKGGASADPFLCLELERALDEAKKCVADVDCGQIVESWTCDPARALPGVVPRPPLVNLRADVREVELLFGEAARAGGCSLVTYGCNGCIVDGYGCFGGRCDWRSVDCGPPPN